LGLSSGAAGTLAAISGLALLRRDQGQMRRLLRRDHRRGGSRGADAKIESRHTSRTISPSTGR
jgi:hypothetical protein